MAISDIKEYAHLTEADIEALGQELDAIRRDVEDSRGERDAKYIQRTIAFQRSLMVAGRLVLFASRKKPAWLLGSALLGVGKIIENMELGHNVIHGQWDWMNDPEIHSTNWEWDNTCPSSGWKHSHNFTHHKFTNIVGLDNDVGYGILRITRDQKWEPKYLAQPLFNALLATFFEWGVALHHLETDKLRTGEVKWSDKKEMAIDVVRKVGSQVGKDYILFPLLTGPAWKSTLTANATANIIRNYCRHLLRALPRRRREVHGRGVRGRDAAGVVSTTDAGQRELRGGQDAGVHDWKPLLPDRTSPVPGSAEQQVRGDRRQDPATVR